MIFRLSAPNWERPSPDYGSHIIMPISGIYLLISIHTLYHSQVLSLIQVHEITYFHHTLCLLKYTSAPFSSLAPTDSSRRTLSISITFFTVYRGLLAGGQLYTPYHGFWSTGELYPVSLSRISPACSTSSAGWSVRTSVRMSNNLRF